MDETHSKVGSMKQVILIVIECLRADHIHCYGYERETSPVIDSIVTDKRGIMWANFKANACETAGTFAHINHTARRMTEEGGPKIRALFTANSFGIGPLRNPRGLTVFPIKVTFENNDPGQKARPLADRITNAALNKLPKNKPFFAAIHYTETHDPYRAFGHAAPFIGDDRYKADVERHGEKRAERIARYDGAIKFVDSKIRSILDGFPGAEIFITGDHGEGLWERRGLGHGYGLFEELIRVPLVVRSPEPINLTHRVMNEPADHHAMEGTILSRFGLDAAKVLPWPYEDDGIVQKRLEGLGYLGREDGPE